MQTTRNTALRLTALAALGVAAAPAASAAVYVTGSGGEFGTLDISSGAFTPIGPQSQQTNILGLGFMNGTLYGVATSGYGNSAQIYTIDTSGPDAGVETPEGDPIAGMTVRTATPGSGVFYVLSTSGTFDTIDPTTQTATSVEPSNGLSNLSSPDGFLVEQGGTLYATTQTATTDELYRVDPSTGNTTDVGDTGTAGDFLLVSGVNDDGTVYGFGSTDGNMNNIVKFDFSQGAAASLFGSYTLTADTVDEITAAAEGPADASPAPEPSQYGMLALVGLGLGGLLLRARKRQATA